MENTHINNSISTRFTIIVGIILLCVGLFIFFYFPSSQKAESVRNLELRAVVIGQIIANSVSAGLVFEDVSAVKSASESLIKIKDVSFVLITRKDGNVFLDLKGVDVSSYMTKIKENFSRKDNTYIDFDDAGVAVCPVKSGSDIIGYVVLGLSKQEMNDAVTSDRWTTLLIGLVITLLGAFAIRYISGRLIFKPLKQLSDTATEIASGNFSLAINATNRTDEIGVLTKSTGSMLESIKHAISTSEEKNREAQRLADESLAARASLEEQQAYLSRNVEKILAAMNRFSDGDLTVQLDIEKDDDVGRLFEGFNNAVSNISELINKLLEVISATSSAATQISSSTEEMAAGAQEQSTQTIEVATAVEQMTRTIIETAKNSSVAAEAARNSGNKASEGGKVVSETIKGMNRISEVVSKSADTVYTLGINSNKIGEIVQVIDEIADQTNLLALNAAIEAARAGEQGRGFAVVADEVRKLAERTTKATKEIAAMIRQIQKDTTDAVDSIKEGTKEVEAGKQLATQAGKVLNEIVESSQKVTDIVVQVAAASEQQSSTAEEIGKSTEAMSNVTNESTQGIQQIARAAEDLNRLTVNLQELIGRFQVSRVESKALTRTVKRLR